MPNQLKIKIETLSDKEIYNILTKLKEEYQPEAIALAKNEFDKRGLRLEDFKENLEEEIIQYEPYEQIIEENKIEETAFENKKYEGPKGIGGWLILPLIGLIISPLYIVYITLTVFLEELNNPFIPAKIQWIINVEFYGNLVIAISSVVLLVLLLTKARVFPKLMIAFYTCNLLFVIWDYYMVQSIHINSFPSELLRSTVVAAIWIPYFIYSKRVKNTFYGVQNQNAITQESENILIKGAINGDVELIKAQIAIGEDVETKDNSGFTPLIWAACEGHLDCLKTLIKLGANVNATDNDDNNVLFWSINENKKACFIELIKAGANIEYRDKDGFTTFMWAIYLCRIEMIKILKESGADIRSVDNSGNGAKYWAQSGFEEGKMSAQDYASILKLIDN